MGTGDPERDGDSIPEEAVDPFNEEESGNGEKISGLWRIGPEF
jgi:hypothetical protein